MTLAVENMANRIRELFSESCDKVDCYFSGDVDYKKLKQVGLNDQQAQVVLNSLGRGPEPFDLLWWDHIGLRAVRGTVENDEEDDYRKVGLEELAFELKKNPPIFSGLAKMFHELPWFCLTRHCKYHEQLQINFIEEMVVALLEKYPEYRDRIPPDMKEEFFKRKMFVALAFARDKRAMNELPKMIRASKNDGIDKSINNEKMRTYALGKFGREAIPLLLQIAGDPTTENFAMDMLGDMGDASVVPNLIEIAKKGNDKKFAACFALADIGTMEAKKTLMEWAANGDIAAIDAISHFKNEETVNVLATVMQIKTYDDQVKIAVVRSLKNIGTPRSRQVLKDFLEKKANPLNKSVKKAIMDALEIDTKDETPRR